jgi:transposase-like protein
VNSDIPSDAKIRKFIRHIVFGKNIFCPNCQSRCVVKDNQRYRCKKCRSRFSLLSHTWLSNSKISLSKLWTIIWCYTAQIPIKQASSISDISCKGIRCWYQKFRENLPREKCVLEAIVQLDEAYFGGFKGKCLLMAKQKGTRKLAYRILDNEPTKLDAILFIKKHVKPGAVVCTDGFSIYKGIGKYYPVEHRVDIHKAWEYSNTSEIEGVFGNLRTFIRRMYHHTTVKNLENIVSEFCFRFSHPEIYKNPHTFPQITLSLVTTGY